MSLAVGLKTTQTDRSPWRSRRRLIRAVFGIVGVGFLAASLVGQWDHVKNQLTIRPIPVLVAGGLVTFSVAALAQAWALLLPDGQDRRRGRRMFYLAQPAKYVPGGVLQPLGLIGFAVSDSVPARSALAAFAIHAIIGVVANAVIAAGAVFVSSAPTWLRAVSVAGVMSPLLLWRPVTARLLALIRVVRPTIHPTFALPSQGRIAAASLWALAGAAASALAFALVAAGTLDLQSPVIVVLYAAAFTAGYLAIPFPSGVGVREGVLALTVPAVGLAPIVAVSAVHRGLAMIGELVMVGTTSRRER